MQQQILFVLVILALASTGVAYSYFKSVRRFETKIAASKPVTAGALLVASSLVFDLPSEEATRGYFQELAVPSAHADVRAQQKRNFEIVEHISITSLMN